MIYEEILEAILEEAKIVGTLILVLVIDINLLKIEGNL